ncbi:MAG: rpfG1 [Chloroflexi bacterium]|nr:rpfG1 [Chloroflexota bacterium]
MYTDESQERGEPNSHELSSLALGGPVAQVTAFAAGQSGAMAREIEALRAQVADLQRELANARAIAMASEATQLGRSLLYYVLDVVCALLHPQRGSTIVVDINDDSLKTEPKDTKLVVGPMQMILERPGLGRAIGGKASRVMTRYESVVWLPIMHGSEVAVILCLRRSPNNPFSIQEQEIGELLGPLTISALQTGRRLFELQEDPEALRSLTTALEACIRGGGGRVAARERDAERLAQVFNMTKQAQQTVHMGAILHDIGTVDLAEDVLHASGTLTKRDFDQVRQHPVFGAEIVRQLPGMEDVIPLVLHHHERWDGVGYPNGLAGEDIPLGARIIAVVDAFHTMISPGAFDTPRTVDNALLALKATAGSQYDPAVVEAFVRLVRES